MKHVYEWQIHLFVPDVVSYPFCLFNTPVPGPKCARNPKQIVHTSWQLPQLLDHYANHHDFVTAAFNDVPGQQDMPSKIFTACL